MEFNTEDMESDTESTEVIEIELKDSKIYKIQEFCDINDLSFAEFFELSTDYYLDKKYIY